MDFYRKLKQEQLPYQLRTKPIRTILITLALIANLGTHVEAGEKIRSKECEGIAKTIDPLLSLTPELWDRLKATRGNDRAAVE